MLNKEDINSLELFNYCGEIFLVEQEEDFAKAIKLLEQEEILGFDTEAKPNFSKNSSLNAPALIQLATSKLVVLIPLTKISFKEELINILANPKIIKAGVAIRDDMKALEKISPFQAVAMCDLADMTKALDIKCFGLRTITANFMNVRISKNVRCSNWENNTLSPKQLLYAATDAYLSRELFLILQKKLIEKNINLHDIIDKNTVNLVKKKKYKYARATDKRDKHDA